MIQRSRSRRRTILFRTIAVVLAFLLALLLCEAALRVAGGYEMFRLDLRRKAAAPGAAAAEAAMEAAGRPLEEFLRPVRARGDLDPEWLRDFPPPLPRAAVLPELRERFERWKDGAINYVLNETLVDSELRAGGGVLWVHLQRARGEEVFVSPGPDGSPHPTYRYLPGVTLPSGLTTNSFGWRGPEAAVRKPPRTVRIACVGASTTVDGHELPASYPELLQHWLGRWAAKNGIGLSFEVVNAGREGIAPPDIAAVVRYEVLPLSPDYVVYYEGVNRFRPAEAVRVEGKHAIGQPPDGTVPDVEGLAARDPTLLDRLARWSATAERLRNLAETVSIGAEPAKPAQTIVLPEGLDEQRPDPTLARKMLDLDTIQDSLDRIRSDTGARGGRLLLCTFSFLADQGLVLDPGRHRGILAYLNRLHWPFSYATLRRLMDLQNRVFKAWARDHDVELIDVDARMPRNPDLYVDAVHQNAIGVAFKAWCVLEGLTLVIRRDFEAARIPIPQADPQDEHPWIKPWRRRRLPG